MRPKFKLTKGGIQYFDSGGTVMNVAPNGVGSNNLGGLGQTNDPTSTVGVAGMLLGNPNVPAATVGNQVQGFASDFTPQNQFSAQLAPVQQSNYGNVINSAATNALNGNNAAYGNIQNQNSLASMLMAEGQGQGPNPALATLNNQTGQNINAQAALMAGQRGASSNPGLAARQIAQNGAAVQQNAIGTEAAQQAQNELNAQNAVGNIYGQVGNEITGTTNANTGLFTGAAGAQNTQNTGSINNYAMSQGINAQTAQNNAAAEQKTTGGLTNGIGALASLLAKGGVVGRDNPKVAMVPESDRYEKRPLPPHLKLVASIYHPKMADGGAVSPAQAIMSGFTGSTGSAGITQAGNNLASAIKYSGGKINGKAKVKGDSYQNDTVSAKLSPGEVVIPRSIMQSDDPAGNAAKFVAKLAKQHPKDAGEDEMEFKTALKKAISGRGKR